ncbi:MAG: response regulator [Polyangiaceae bacterium]
MAADKAEVPLSRRLMVAIIAPVGLLLVLGAVLGFQILRMAETARYVDRSDAVIARTNDLQKQIIDQETGIRGYLLSGDRVFLQPYLDARPLPLFVEIDALLSLDQERQLLREARARYERWLSTAKTVADGDGRAPAGDELKAAMHSRKLEMDAVRASIAQVIAGVQRVRAERSLASEAATKTTLGATLALSVLLAALLGFVSRSQIRDVAGAFTATLERERAATRRTEDESWVRAGNVAVAESMQGDLLLAELGRRALENIVKSTGADVGAFYVREADGLSCIAGHAMDASTAPVFKTGQGVVGQAAVGGEVVELADVPPDYLTVASATGKHAPATVLVVPARVEQTTHAVLELAFLHHVDERSKELLRRVGEAVALAVRSGQQKLRLRELLEESQRQSEELAGQGEELRVANEELTQQSDLLRLAHAQLEERKEELEASNSDLASQRNALQRAQGELGHKADELERASKYKSEFLANMSHELCTPLNSTLILAKLLADNKHDNLTAEQVKFAQTIYGAGNDLLALINDILDLSKIEAGKMEVSATSLRIRDLVEPVKRTFEPIAKDKGVELEVRLADGDTVIETDAQRAQQVLKNLLSNALKFTDKGKVTLTAERSGDDWTFSVTDTGIGIPSHQQEVIFEAFRQADGTTNRRFGGTGLGLSISRDLARLLGGDLRVESEPGKGSRFVFTLPPVAPLVDEEDGDRQAVRAAEPPPLSVRPRRRTTIAERHPVQRRLAESGPASRPLPTPQVADDRDHLERGRRLLLIVEDDVRFAEILTRVAHELEFQCLVAHEAVAGIRLAIEHQPSAIVLDMNLPDHSGLFVLDRLKRAPETRHIPVHVVSAEDHTQAARSMGAIGYLLKPTDIDELRQALAHLKERFARMRRLLVVEDDAVQRDAIAHLLDAGGLEIVAVATVSEALQQLAASTFDCVVTDLTLPDGTGFDLLEKMAGDQKYSFPPVIVYTGRQLTAEQEQQLRRYSSSIIVKGARSPERLLDEVTLFLHQVESELPQDRQRMLRQARDREAVFEGRTILVAEDDVRNIFALTSVLEPKGAKLVLARNGREAVERVQDTATIDLVLMDIMMPEMDGLQAMRAIRKLGGRAARMPIIALTAKAMRDDQERCLQAGANDYIAKPFDVEVLLSLIRVWISKQAPSMPPPAAAGVAGSPANGGPAR